MTAPSKTTGPVFVSFRAREAAVRDLTGDPGVGVLLSAEDVIAPAGVLTRLGWSETSTAIPDFEVVVAPTRDSDLPVERFIPARVGVINGAEAGAPEWVLIRLGSLSRYAPAPGRIGVLADFLSRGVDAEKAFRSAGFDYPEEWAQPDNLGAIGDPGGREEFVRAPTETALEIQETGGVPGQVANIFCYFTDKCNEAPPTPGGGSGEEQNDPPVRTFEASEIRVLLRDGSELLLVMPGVDPAKPE